MKLNTNIKLLNQLIAYFGIGAAATIVEWLLFYLLNYNWSIHYACATTLAFIFSTFVNWFLGRLLLFKVSARNILQELLYVYAASIIGLCLNLIIMYILIEKFVCFEMLAKIVATGLVFFWNFGVRKLFIYKK